MQVGTALTAGLLRFYPSQGFIRGQFEFPEFILSESSYLCLQS